jgi:hypothetical protein
MQTQRVCAAVCWRARAVWACCNRKAKANQATVRVIVSKTFAKARSANWLLKQR